jgi:hypothetical protein
VSDSVAAQLAAFLRYAELVEAGFPRDEELDRRAEAAMHAYVRRQPTRKLARR